MEHMTWDRFGAWLDLYHRAIKQRFADAVNDDQLPPSLTSVTAAALRPIAESGIGAQDAAKQAIDAYVAQVREAAAK